ncbi:MAG: hypothetical protein U9R51_09535 [Actinomycetota bacterium]|nr:hypothetical protein [Actinomycetota bacterium]
MKRLWITLLAVAMALATAMPAGAVKPPINCDQTPNHPACSPAPPVIECVFDDDGVLLGWDGSERCQCQWTVTEFDRQQPFDFRLEPVSPDGKSVNLPHLIVTDVYPYGGQICFNEYEVGWDDLPYSWTQFTLPEDGLCTGGGGDAYDGKPDVFAITISVGKVKKGAVELTYMRPADPQQLPLIGLSFS